MLPLFGKTGTIVPPDPALGAILGLLLGMPISTIFTNEFHSSNNNNNRLTNKKRFGVVIIIITTVCCMFGLNSYSVDRPKRLWVQHILRDMHSSMNEYTIDREEEINIISISHNHSVIHDHNNNHTLPHMHAHVHAQGHKDHLNDHGLWISGFDGLGLSPIRDAIQNYPTFSLKNNHIKKHHGECNKYNGECYLHYPWYHPVAEVIADNMFIPTVASPTIPSEKRLRLWANYIDTTYDNNSVISHHNEGIRLVELHVKGPCHMNIILQDELISFNQNNNNNNNNKKKSESSQYRIKRWDLSGQSLKSNLVPVSPIRHESIHYLSLSFGSMICSLTDGCHKKILLEIIGVKPIEVSLYGHYTDASIKESNPTLKSLDNHLPEWANGAKWTNFPSVLIKRSV
eukprot:gene15930-21611_t